MERMHAGFYAISPLRQFEPDVVELARSLWEEREVVRDTLRDALETEMLPAARYNFLLLREQIIGLRQAQRQDMAQWLRAPQWRLQNP